MNTFGELLQGLRLACRDSNQRQLSQARLGELVGRELGMKMGYSGAAISDWEHDKSKINKDDRLVLIAILKVLQKEGGLKALPEAESLLAAGNYRALDEDEKKLVFPNNSPAASTETTAKEPIQKTAPTNLPLSFLSVFDFQSLVSDQKDSASPTWSLIATALMRQISNRMEKLNWGRLFFWLLVWVSAYALLGPALHWPFPSRQTAWEAIIIHIGASLILPLYIGALTNTKDNPVWVGRENASQTMVRAYTYQGAFIGFHIGYFSIFAIHLIAFYFQLLLPTWLQFGLAGFPLFMGAIGAHVVPDNLWRAYDRLRISDGAAFFIFILFGPLWGWFFFKFHSILISPITGVVVILAAVILSAGLFKVQRHRKEKTASPR
jgi:transcriptional regulator with XRE-family HTH domain